MIVIFPRCVRFGVLTICGTRPPVSFGCKKKWYTPNLTKSYSCPYLSPDTQNCAFTSRHQYLPNKMIRLKIKIMRLEFTARDTIMFHNFCSMRSFFKRKNALESWEWELSNAFFRLKNDLLEQKLWAILVNRFLGVKLFPHDSSKMQLRAKWYSGEKPYVLFVFSWNETLKKQRQRITVSDTAKSEKPCPAYSKNAIWNLWRHSTMHTFRGTMYPGLGRI